MEKKGEREREKEREEDEVQYFDKSYKYDDKNKLLN